MGSRKPKETTAVVHPGIQILGTLNGMRIFGMDTAKLVFQVYGVDPVDGTSISVQLKRPDVLTFFAKNGPCLIAMEACGGAHYWGRTLHESGHTVRLLPTTLIQPFITGNKSDAIDARAIWLAAQLPDVKYVSVNSVRQQSVICLHRQRDTLKKFKTRQLLALRGFLYEFGIIFPKGGRTAFLREVLVILEERSEQLPIYLLESLQDQVDRIKKLDESIDCIDARLQHCFQEDPDMQRIAGIPGVGMLTATAMIATMGDPATFTSAREFCAWLGLVPRQSGSGGKIQMLGMSKKGNPYLRTLLIHGARSVLYRSKGKDPWLDQMAARRPFNVAVVAQAAKTARRIWAITMRQEPYDAVHGQIAPA